MGLSMRLENGKSIDPRTLKRADKEKLVGKIMVCNCRKDKKLEYSFRSGTLALYPKQNKYSSEHRIFCELNDIYNKRDKCSTLSKDEKGNMTAKLKENITHRPKRYEGQLIQKLYIKKRPSGSESRDTSINLSALIKDINLEACYRQSQWMRFGKQDAFKSMTDYNKVVWAIAKDTSLSDRDITMAGESLKPYGAKFDYSTITGLSQMSFLAPDERKMMKSTSITRNYLESTLKERNDKNLKTYLRLHYISNFDGKERWTQIDPKALYYGARHFLDTYKMDVIDFEKDNISGGFYSYEVDSHIDQKSGKSYADYVIDRLTMLLVNKYGVFSESRYEAAAYDAIMDFCAENKGLYPYKPYRFTTNAYGGDFIEDMYIAREDGKDIIVEIFGMMGNDDYAEKARLKEKYMSESRQVFDFLPWYPQKEGADVLIGRLAALKEKDR